MYDIDEWMDGWMDGWMGDRMDESGYMWMGEGDSE